MTIDVRTQAQFAEDLATALLALTQRYDTSFGPVYDLHQALASVLAAQHNDRLRHVDQLIALQDLTGLTDAEIEARVSDEGILRTSGGQAFTTLTFYQTGTATPGSFTLPSGFPVGSVPNSSGARVTYVTTESRTNLNAVYNPTSNRQEITVPAVSLTVGTSAQVGANKLTEPLRNFPGTLNGVTNLSRSVGGEAALTNEALVNLYRLAVASRQLATATGSEFYVRDQYQSSVSDALEIYGTDSRLVRTEPSAVDLYILGDVDQAVVGEEVVFTGYGQLLPFSLQPLAPSGVSSVTISGGATIPAYVAGAGGYQVVLDTGPYKGSIRARDGIVILPGTAVSPVEGDTLLVNYTYNSLVPAIQTQMELPDIYVPGRDLLIKQGEQVDLLIEGYATRTSARYSTGTLQGLIQDAIYAHVNSLGLGKPIEISDLQLVVRAISGIDNFVVNVLELDTFTEVPEASLGVSYTTRATDMTLAVDEFARIVMDKIIIRVA